MQTPYSIFGVDQRGTALTYAMLVQWPHEQHPTGFTSHFPLHKLDARGMAYTCQMLGHIALGQLALRYPDVLGHLDIFPPTPQGTDRFVDNSSNVEELVIERDAIRDEHLAVGLSASSLMLVIAERSGHSAIGVEIGRTIPFVELDAMGPEAACTTVGDIVLRKLIEQHGDVFAHYPHLAFQPQDQP